MNVMQPTPVRHAIAKASVADTLALVAEVVLPTFSKGVLIRRPAVEALSEAMELDARAVERLRRLRDKYGPGPLVLAIPFRSQAVILCAEDVRRVLEDGPEPFAPRTAEKHSALSKLEPKASLISHGPERDDRRRFNERVLGVDCPVHSLADTFVRVVREEARALLDSVGETLSWNDFTIAWHKAVRRVVLGDGARDDHALTDRLAKLRRAGNWAFLHPGRPGLLRAFHDHLDRHLARAEPGSLAAVIAETPKTDVTAPSHQVAHYLFAFDPGGMAAIRTLALLASHPGMADRARAEIAEAGPEGLRNLPFLRACVLDCLRLWPTTPAILRQTTRDVPFEGGVMPKGTHVVIFAPFFHRDEERLPHAHRFAPDEWLGKEPDGRVPLVPFSAGHGVCPARHFVPMMTSAMVAAILESREVSLADPDRLRPNEPLPDTLDHNTLSFRLQATQDLTIPSPSGSKPRRT